MSQGFIAVRGARSNNLKNIDIDIPRNQLVVITGKSGSGKSSLAFDTIFAEGQRQFVESLSLYSRQFFNQNSRSDVDEIEGLPPTVCINQHRGSRNPRSTVATMTEIYDYLRLLFSKLGDIECPDCGVSLNPQSLDSICDQILGLEERTKVMILANMVSAKKGKHADALEAVRKERLVRVRINGEIFDIENVPEINGNVVNTIDAVTDRIMVREGIESRLRESIEMAVKLSGGSVIASFCPPGSEEWSEEFYSTAQACSQCGMSCPEVLPRTFSFNSPFGACSTCEGLGAVEAFDVERLIPDFDLPVNQAVAVWQPFKTSKRRKCLTALKPLLKEFDIDKATPLSKLSEEQRDSLLYSREKKSPGVLTVLEREFATSDDEDWLDALESYRGQIACGGCDATRLNRFANSIRVGGLTIANYCALDLQALSEAIEQLSLIHI